MTRDTLRYRSYRWHGIDEWLAEAGSGPTVLIVPPLFEELNRCRKLIADVMRGLAGHGLGAVLPDLPGTGESMRDLTQVAWSDWSGALAALTSELASSGEAPYLASFRGGCLIEPEGKAAGRWRFAPVAGRALARDLIRARQAALPEKVRAEAIEAEARSAPTEFAGYPIPPELFGALSDAELPDTELPDTGAARVVRLESDPAAADLKLAGKPLWRQAEPGSDPPLAAALAADIAQWIRTCGA